MITLSIVIPCYNEAQNIFPLFEKIENLLLKKNNLEIIIVNNGSTDNTKENILSSTLYLNKKIKIFNIKKNIGYGFGIMSGVKIANGDVIGWCHADLQTEPEDVYNAFVQYKDKLLKEKTVSKGNRVNRNFLTIYLPLMSILTSNFF